jgi:hypothetical protein
MNWEILNMATLGAQVVPGALIPVKPRAGNSMPDQGIFPALKVLFPSAKPEPEAMNSIANTLLRVTVLLAFALLSCLAPAAEPTLGMNEQAIHDAARMGKRQDVEIILKSSPQARDARTPLGMTPLHYAAMNEDSGPLQALLAAGAAVNARDGEGRTPLHMAAFSTRTANGKLLLQAGADPTLKTDAGRDVLSMARKVRADELAGIISLWILKDCKPGKPC